MHAGGQHSGGKAQAAVRSVFTGYLRQVPTHGPGTKGRRQKLKKVIGYLTPGLEMMRYAEWRGRIGDRRVGRWKGRFGTWWASAWIAPACLATRQGQAVLQLRCIELNGDWNRFFAWVQGSTEIPPTTQAPSHSNGPTNALNKAA